MSGVVKYFYHSPSSALPVPDVLGEVKNPKTEYCPLPDGRFAENWINECQQRTIRMVADRGLDTLFWVTRCRDRESIRYEKQLIVGYLQVEEIVSRPTVRDGEFIRTHPALVGTPVLVRFTDALLTTEVFGFTYDRPKFLHRQFVQQEVSAALKTRLDGLENIATQCAREIERLCSGRIR